MRNAARHPARSVLTVALLACATFILVIVGSMRQGVNADMADRRSGSGGNPLLLTADVPLTGDLNTAAGRRLLAVSQPDDPLWQRARFVQLRRRPGQDVSCLNMTYPTQPTILGVPAATIRDGGFAFAPLPFNVKDRATVAAFKSGNPWMLLGGSWLLGPGSRGKTQDPITKTQDPIPFIADEATAKYSLHIDLGGTLTVADQFGTQVALRLVAMLSGSIFQSELLISEENFHQLYPGQGGFGMVLVRAPQHDLPELRRRLADDLAPWAVSAELSADRLAAYNQVANTYLSTFQALGALGLLLGTVGLAVVLIRSLIERRSELALLAALGFSPGRRLVLVLAENGWLLVLGAGIGAGCALLGVLPGVASGQHPIDVGGLLVTLAGTIGFGLLSLVLAAMASGRHLSPAALRAE